MVGRAAIQDNMIVMIFDPFLWFNEIMTMGLNGSDAKLPRLSEMMVS
jgi:hypothetical protein